MTEVRARNLVLENGDEVTTIVVDDSVPEDIQEFSEQHTQHEHEIIEHIEEIAAEPDEIVLDSGQLSLQVEDAE